MSRLRSKFKNFILGIVFWLIAVIALIGTLLGAIGKEIIWMTISLVVLVVAGFLGRHYKDKYDSG